MLLDLFGLIMSIIILLMLYYSTMMFLKTLNIKLPPFLENLDIVKWFSSPNKKLIESMTNINSVNYRKGLDSRISGSNGKIVDKDVDPLKTAIDDTQYFNTLPTAFETDKDSSFFSFLTKFDPSFKPPKYKAFPYKATMYTVDYKCRKSTTGMFTDCGPMSSNSCK